VTYPLDLRVNGVRYSTAVEPHQSLLDVLRRQLGVTGPKEGCDDSECGACMVLVDSGPVNSCCLLALQAAGQDVTTVEGIADSRVGARLSARMLEEGGVQCGFCTPGIMVMAAALLTAEPNPDEQQIRNALAGNLCRCTGYQKIVSAVAKAAADLSK
jgi:aerobic-type carbon monoxide dehydrogenase small subunit (CoxS/CutS family)